MECGECTLCCKLLAVPEINKLANVLCKYCIGGCKIQDSKPKECFDFNCMYVQMDNAHVSLRPDKCHIIFEKLSDTIIYGTHDSNHEITDIGKRQVNEFMKQGFSVVLMKPGAKKRSLFVAKNHDSNIIKKEFNKYLTKKYGRCNIQY